MPGLRPTLRLPAIAQYVRPISVGDPSAFLEILAGEVRGYWGKGERWTAWGGKLAELRLPMDEIGTSGPGEGTTRFAAIREAAESSGHGALRWFGGFGFLPTQPHDPRWEEFPPARFVLPRILLESKGSEVLLTLQSLDGEEQLAEESAAIIAALAAKAGANLGQAPDGESRQGEPEPGAGGGEGSEKGAWFDSVGHVLSEIEAGRLEKVVLARVRDISLPKRVELPGLLAVLRGENPDAHLFLFEMAPDRVFFGAAPELLAEVREGRFAATVVAGSMPRSPSGEGDTLLSESLLESAKDRREHLLTAEEMTAALSPRLREMQVEEEPRVLTLSRIHHLETTIEGGIRDGEDILSLVEALHPTPAVCGRPREAAFACIREAERFDRGWYSGPVGWFDLEGEGSFVPALRTAVGGGDQWRLFAGAGIVSGSQPGPEWDETTLKFQSALQALRMASAATPGVG
jgi:menaquinone-specific isochorismate synthase